MPSSFTLTFLKESIVNEWGARGSAEPSNEWRQITDKQAAKVTAGGTVRKTEKPVPEEELGGRAARDEPNVPGSAGNGHFAADAPVDAAEFPKRNSVSPGDALASGRKGRKSAASENESRVPEGEPPSILCGGEGATAKPDAAATRPCARTTGQRDDHSALAGIANGHSVEDTTAGEKSHCADVDRGDHKSSGGEPLSKPARPGFWRTFAEAPDLGPAAVSDAPPAGYYGAMSADGRNRERKATPADMVRLEEMAARFRPQVKYAKCEEKPE